MLNLQEKTICSDNKTLPNPLIHLDTSLLEQEVTEDKSRKQLELIKHEEILKQLLTIIMPIDFRSCSELDEVEKIKNSHLQIIVVEKILELAIHHNWGIYKNNDFIYVLMVRIELSK